MFFYINRNSTKSVFVFRRCIKLFRQRTISESLIRRKRMGRPKSSTDEKYQKSASNQVHWCCLPSPALEKIYYLVSREDKFRMSLVCRWWSKEFYSSSASTTFRFAFSRTQLLNMNCRSKLKRFVRKHGINFQHVEIECIHYEEIDLIHTWKRLFKEFLSYLTRNSHLISVKFHGLSFYYFLYDDICRAIVEFMGSQYHLQMVVFKDCYFTLPIGLDILRNLVENNRKSLSHLSLKGFIQNHHTTSVENQPSLLDLLRLTTLEIDYSLIFENMFIVLRQGTLFKTLKKGQKLALSKIILHLKDLNVQNFQGLTATDWHGLKILCPDLEVELIIQKLYLFHKEEEFFIVSCMPITRLIFTIDFVLKPDAFFSHLLACKINKSLDYLSLYSHAPILDLASTLTPFIQACKKLRQFVLSVVYETDVSVPFIESLIHIRPKSLNKVDIIISKTKSESDYMTVMNLIDPFASLLRIAGLKLRVFNHDWLRDDNLR